jgi:hypothetical protein
MNKRCIQKKAKKLFIAGNILVSVLALTAASSFWEGASSTDTYGELPDRGFYVATSFFPRNTVVDITNLENGRTIQAIVAGNLSSPGGMVILSRDAAEALSLGGRTSSRIRMSPPVDSVAFSRFSDGRSFSGDPDYDPRAFIKENSLPIETQPRIAVPYARQDSAPYAGDFSATPPPVKVIPDPPAPKKEETIAATQPLPASEIRRTLPPPVAPPEPVTIFMPAPVPQALPEEALAAAPLPASEISRTLPPPVAPPEPVTIFMPAPIPQAIMVEELAPAEAPAVETAEATVPEMPEVYSSPYLYSPGRQFALTSPDAPRAFTIPEPEPENPFPDINSPYPNPIEYTAQPRLVLDEAVINKAYELAENNRLEAEKVEQQEQPPEVVLPGALPNESIVRPYLETPTVIAAVEPESENQFPDVSSPYPNPVEYSAQPRMVLDEAVDKTYELAETDKQDVERVEEQKELPEVVLPGSMFRETESIAALSDASIISPYDMDETPITETFVIPEVISPGTIPLESTVEIALAENDDKTGLVPDVSVPGIPPDYAGPGHITLADVANSSLTDVFDVLIAEEEEKEESLTPDTISPALFPYEDEVGPLTDAAYTSAMDEYLSPDESSTEIADSDLYDALFQEDSPETTLNYAEPSMEGTIELVDGNWVLRDADGNEFLLGAETSLAYAEPGTEGTIELLDGNWVLRDADGNEFLLVAETSLAYAEPSMEGTVELLDGNWVLRDADGNEFLLGAETSLAYAEPSMEGTIELVDGNWVLRDADGNEFLLGAETSLAYAEPGTEGTVELLDGNWVLRDADGNEFLLGAEVTPPYAEPSMEGTVELVDGSWVLRDAEGNEFPLGAETSLAYAEPELSYSGEFPAETADRDLYDALFREDAPETTLAYAEPGMEGTIELVDGSWVLRDAEGNEFLLGAEASLAYAEPSMEGTVELVDGSWVLRDAEGNEFLLGAEASLAYAEPSMEGTIELVDGRWVLRDAEGNEFLLGAEASLAYAEPGMEGTVELVDGRWILKDSADVTYLIPVPPEAMTTLREAYFMDRADASILYAEPGMTGTIELVEGYWTLSVADTVYLIPFLEETVPSLHEPFFRESADTGIPYAEPGMTGIVTLIDGYWVLKDDADALYLIPSPQDARIRLQEARIREREHRFPDRPEVMDSLPYIEVSPVVLDSPGYLPENEARLRKIYETILKLETAPDRPPEVIMDLGPVGKELYSGGAADAGSASLLLIKNISSGKYYLQIGLFDRRDALARKLTGLNWAYPYALETAGTSRSPRYKLLVGPVNEGESNALLLRFKRYGYHDAFIRGEG